MRAFRMGAHLLLNICVSFFVAIRNIGLSFSAIRACLLQLRPSGLKQ